MGMSGCVEFHNHQNSPDSSPNGTLRRGYNGAPEIA